MQCLNFWPKGPRKGQSYKTTKLLYFMHGKEFERSQAIRTWLVVSLISASPYMVHGCGAVM